MQHNLGLKPQQMNSRLLILIAGLGFLAGCQSSRFMQDDMYFTDLDANREINEYQAEQNIKRGKANEEDEVKSNFTLDKDVIEINNTYYTDADFTYDDYYDYSYTSRIRRFQRRNNTWGYYDPYYTNYYWFDNSNSSLFGNSVYSTYSWWGPNFGNNYNYNYWGTTTWGNGWYGNNWCNPWTNSWYGNGWYNPYNPYAYNGWNNPWNNNGYWYGFNNGLAFGNLYYNSYDNNCYWWWWKSDQAPSGSQTNFVMLMQSNGISKDVIERPQINYTAIRENANKVNTPDSNTSSNTDVTVQSPNNNTVHVDEVNTNKANSNNNTIVITNYENDNVTNKGTQITTYKANNNNGNNQSTVNTNQSNSNRRYNNHNADVNISPNTNNNSSNWSRSGVFSEGSRNNNYEYKGTTTPNQSIQKNNSNNTGTQQKNQRPN